MFLSCGGLGGALTGGYSFHQVLNPQTTPAFMLADTSAGAIAKLGGQVIRDLCTTSTLGIRPGIPITVDYEGDLLHFNGSLNKNAEFSIGYILWHDDDAKKASIWRSSFRDSPRNKEIGISMDSFSSRGQVWDIGTMVPNDKSTAETPAFTEVTAKDFEDGIPVKIQLRLRAFDINDHTKPAGKKAPFNSIELLHPQIVTHQIGGPI